MKKSTLTMPIEVKRTIHAGAVIELQCVAIIERNSGVMQSPVYAKP
jgi:hypothetical protein